MPKLPTRIHGPAAVSNVAATKYTVAAGQQIIVRHIHVENTAAGAVNFTMSIGADAAGTRIYDAFTIAAGAVLDVFCYYVLVAAEIIQAFASVNNQLVLTLDADVYSAG